jgi:hypothetical protein
VKKEKNFFMIPGGTPGTKIVNVNFPGKKLKKVIRKDPLFESDRNKSILKGAAKRPYPPSSFNLNTRFK